MSALPIQDLPLPRPVAPNVPASKPYSSKQLLSQEIWHPTKDIELESWPDYNKVAIHYERAKSILQAQRFTVDDILHTSPKFWALHSDLMAARDTSTMSILAIHLNLALGTISPFAKERPEVMALFQRMLNFEVIGEFMLTETDHGLDAKNIETTATMQADGTYDLHTPHMGAAKSMPPSTTTYGLPRVSVVFAKLISTHGANHGVKPFLVWLSDNGELKAGVTSRRLPQRPGSKPLDHSITSFDHVRLPATSLLGSPDKPKDLRADFNKQIWRIPIGTLSLALVGMPAIKTATHVAAVYSQRRMVSSGNGDDMVPIMSFATQYRPIVNGFVNGAVLEPYSKWSLKLFMDPRVPPMVKTAIAVLFKAAAIQASSKGLVELLERCGWQGLFTYNQISQLSLGFQGSSIAEGDTLVLCIRLASELLGDKYKLPEPVYADSKLAQREKKLFAEARAKLAEIGGYKVHRSEAFNKHILPRCRPLVEAVASRMAYDCAKADGVDAKMLEVFEGWALTQAGAAEGVVDQSSLADAYEAVLNESLIPSLDNSEVEPYFTAPITSEKSWDNFVRSLPLSSGHGIQPKL